MVTEVQVIAASRREGDDAILWTLQLKYWRAIHAEFMTHRVFSRNAGSSRAKPVKTVLSQVWNDPAGPIHWGQNKPGMQAELELDGLKYHLSRLLWKWAGRSCCAFAWGMMKLGLHKQVANRLLEPWQYIDVVVTSNDWENFLALRAHPAAQPEIQELAVRIEFTMDQYLHSIGNKIPVLKDGEWHLPYVNGDVELPRALAASTARCARVSYAPFNATSANIEKDVELHHKLVNANPPHLSPTEHQLTPSHSPKEWSNVKGWKQYRKIVENARKEHSEGSARQE